MAIVTLRAYLDEVQDLISKEALEEAIGHCKYILQSFPKNVAVYRLLGQALLGKARFQEATDVFQRVLSAVPDDLTAHIAMSELYVEQDAIPQATWHLERAFEQDPNNQVLKEELRRMYEQRDGAAPERVQLTRGALARLYYRGRLYEQATAELQAVLETETDRPDLMLLLARTLWDNNHQVEASETALRVLEMLPDALEANALLAGLWLQQKRPSDAVPFVERVQALDPARALGMLAPDDPSAVDQITLPHFDWSAHTNVAMLTDTPEWIQDVGTMFENSATPESPSDPFGLERKAGAASADWMTNFAAPGDSAPPTPDWFAATVPPTESASPAPPVSSIPDALDSMPDWFAEVAQSSQPPESEAPLPSWLGEEEAAPPVAEPPRTPSGYTALLGQIATIRKQQEPIPSWADESTVVPEESPIPSWTDSAPVPTNFESTASPATSEPVIAEGTPDWLSDLGAVSQPPTVEPGLAEPNVVPGNIPDWMSELAPAESITEPTVSPATSEPVIAEGTPDWLSDLGAVSQPPTVESGLAEPDVVPGNIPDWMSELAPAESTTELTVSPATSEPVIAEGTPDWLSDLGAVSQPPTVEPGLAEPDVVPGNIPDWMSELAPAESTAEPTVSPAASEPVIAEGTPDWLSDLAGPASSSQPEPFAPESTPGNVPDWMSTLTAPVSPTPTAESSVVAPEPVLSEPPADDWLNDLAAVSSTPNADPVVPSTPELARDNLPDWMSKLAPPEPAAETAAPAELEAAPGDLPDWMNELSQAEEAPAAQPPASSMPAPELEDDWLRGFEAEPATEESAPPSTPVSQNEAVASVPENDRDWLATVGNAPAKLDDDWLSGFGVVESPVAPQTSAQPTSEGHENWLMDELASQAQPSEAASASVAGPTETNNTLSTSTTEPEPSAEPPASGPRGMTGLLNIVSKSASEARHLDDAGIVGAGQAPDWLTAFNEEPLPAETVPESKPVETVEPVDTPSGRAQVNQAAMPVAEGDSDVPSWLRNIDEEDAGGMSAQTESAPPAQAPTPASTAAAVPAENLYDLDRVPDFISAMAPKPAETPVADTEAGFHFNKTPGWMRKLKK